MGNCLVVQENVVKIMKSDGKVLEYKTPIKVHQVLTQFSGHAISESLNVLRHLHPNAKLLGGQLYYLVPPPMPASPKAGKKKVRFANPEVVEEAQAESSVVRIKLVISKQELQNLLQKGGISVNMLSLVRGERGEEGEVMCNESDDVWKPALESIPEIN